MPLKPHALDISEIIFILCESDKSSSPAINWKANACKASPANIAVASPYLIWFDGIPLLKSSLSIAGKSSCIKEYEWSDSIAVAIFTIDLSLRIFSIFEVAKTIPALRHLLGASDV